MKSYGHCWVLQGVCPTPSSSLRFSMTSKSAWAISAASCSSRCWDAARRPTGDMLRQGAVPLASWGDKLPWIHMSTNDYHKNGSQVVISTVDIQSTRIVDDMPYCWQLTHENGSGYPASQLFTSQKPVIKSMFRFGYDLLLLVITNMGLTTINHT